ncbi:MAG: DUF4157 domain-containing protein, partial [Chloroflexota bacterium]
MTVTAAGDQFEQEADAVASQVVDRLQAPGTAASPANKGLQRQAEEEEELQAKPLSDSISRLQRQEEEEELQMQRQEVEEEEELQAQRLEDEEELQMQRQEEEEELQAQREALEEEELQMQRQEEEEELQMQRQEDEEELQMQRQEVDEEEELQAQRLEDQEELQMQRQEDEEELQMQRQEEEEELQAKAAPIGREGGAVDAATEQSIRQARGNGQRMPTSVRRSMERAFGADFGNVRVHTGSQSDRLNRAISARAFTTGSDIFFRQGAYDPHSRSGQQLLAHELTHVVQQGSAARR